MIHSQKIKTVQYRAALAITATIKGTSAKSCIKN